MVLWDSSFSTSLPHKQEVSTIMTDPLDASILGRLG
ncbi:uncharacterized protein METZ01_LOCUS158314 [marine metagenome]|uniref:Uncharacterized protein n=1 Tax=marine metagenome TaxID=408172 RepID=A0A382AV71_9ZZZZ